MSGILFLELVQNSISTSHLISYPWRLTGLRWRLLKIELASLFDDGMLKLGHGFLEVTTFSLCIQ